MQSVLRVATLLSAIIATGISGADVVGSSENGFELRNEALIAAKPPQVYAALLQIGSWWDSAHTYSGDSRNLWLWKQRPADVSASAWRTRAVCST